MGFRSAIQQKVNLKNKKNRTTTKNGRIKRIRTENSFLNIDYILNSNLMINNVLL